MMNDIIVNYIQEHLLGGSETGLSEEDDLLISGLLDSMSMMSLITFVEKQFQVKIPPQDMTIDNFQTVNAISNYLNRRKSA
jgi:acyl carrier protein